MTSIPTHPKATSRATEAHGSTTEPSGTEARAGVPLLMFGPGEGSRREYHADDFKPCSKRQVIACVAIFAWGVLCVALIVFDLMFGGE